MISLEAPESRARSLDEKIIPMINIIFLLLVFFLIAGNLSELVREDVVPPRSSSGGVAVAAPAAWVLARDGTVIVDGREMTLEEVAGWLAGPGTPRPRRIVLRADGATRSALLLPLMDLLRDRGVEKIALVTINETGGR